MPLFKKLLLVISIAIALLLVSAVAGFFLIDDKTIENNALEALQNTLKREVTVDGEFKLTRSLHPTLHTQGVRIASASWDQNDHLLKAEKLEIGIALLDLLRGIISIENVVFENAIINLKRNKEGLSNVEFSSKDTEQEKSSSLIRLDVIDIQIKNLQANYSDEQNEKSFTYAIDSLTLHPNNKESIQINAKSRFDEQPIEISTQMCRIRHLLAGNDCSLSTKIDTTPFRTQAQGNLNLANNGRLHLEINTNAKDITEFKPLTHISLPSTKSVSAKFLLSGPFNEIKISELDSEISVQESKFTAKGSIDSLNSFSGLNLLLSATGSKPEWINQYQNIFPAGLVDDFNIQTNIEGSANTWKLHSIDTNIKINKSTIHSSGEATISPDATQLKLTLDAKGENPAWLNELQQAIDAQELDKFSVKAEITNPEDIFNIEISDSKFTVNDSSTSAHGTIKIPANNSAQIDFTVDSKGKSLKSFEKLVARTLPASKNYAIKSGITYQPNTLTLSELTVQIDDTKLQGDSDIKLTSPPNIRSQINADKLNVEHILALIEQDKKADTSTTKKEDNKLFTNEPIPLDWLKTANTDISLKIDNLIYKEASLDNIQANVIAKNNQATLEIKSLNYHGANLQTNTSIDANKNTFKHSLHTESFDLGRLLREIDASQTLQGKVDASIDLKSHGATSQEVASNSNGKITAIMTEGSLADAPIDLLASNLLVELMPGKSKKDTTKIECLFVQFSGNAGTFNSEATLLNTENIVMTTNGSVDLGSEKLDLLLIPKPKDIELFTLDSNIRVGGDITDPSFSLDKSSIFKKILKSAATVALGPAALAIPFASMGNNKNEKCFSEVATTTTRAVEAQQEAERKALEEAEKKAKEEAIKEATVEKLE